MVPTMEKMMPRRGNSIAGVASAVQQTVYHVIHDSHLSDENRAARVFNAAMLTLISLNVLVVILETEPGLYGPHARLFHAFDAASVAVFTLEYLLRLWVCVLDARYASPVKGRVRFALTPLALIDLVAILPFFVPLVAVDLRFVRAVRLLRLFRLLKMTRYSQSLHTLIEVFRAKKEQLLVTAFAGSIVLVIASSLVYLAEREIQPEAFSSIPSAMWWGVVTLTTVGYGDIYPKTAIGKIIGGLIAVLGIGMFALPAGIIASGFSEKIAQKRAGPRVCPHCGKEIDDEE